MDNVVILRGIPTELTSAVGHAFVVDCVRAGEGLISDQEVVTKYEIPLEGWKKIIENTVLIRAIRAESQRRVRNGTAARESAPCGAPPPAPPCDPRSF